MRGSILPVRQIPYPKRLDKSDWVDRYIFGAPLEENYIEEEARNNFSRTINLNNALFCVPTTTIPLLNEPREKTPEEIEAEQENPLSACENINRTKNDHVFTQSLKPITESPIGIRDYIDAEYILQWKCSYPDRALRTHEVLGEGLCPGMMLFSRGQVIKSFRSDGKEDWEPITDDTRGRRVLGAGIVELVETNAETQAEEVIRYVAVITTNNTFYQKMPTYYGYPQCNADNGANLGGDSVFVLWMAQIKTGSKVLTGKLNLTWYSQGFTIPNVPYNSSAIRSKAEFRFPRFIFTPRKSVVGETEDAYVPKFCMAYKYQPAKINNVTQQPRLQVVEWLIQRVNKNTAGTITSVSLIPVQQYFEDTVKFDKTETHESKGNMSCGSDMNYYEKVTGCDYWIGCAWPVGGMWYRLVCSFTSVCTATAYVNASSSNSVTTEEKTEGRQYLAVDYTFDGSLIVTALEGIQSYQKIATTNSSVSGSGTYESCSNCFVSIGGSGITESSITYTYDDNIKFIVIKGVDTVFEVMLMDRGINGNGGTLTQNVLYFCDPRYASSNFIPYSALQYNSAFDVCTDQQSTSYKVTHVIGESNTESVPKVITEGALPANADTICPTNTTAPSPGITQCFGQQCSSYNNNPRPQRECGTGVRCGCCNDPAACDPDWDGDGQKCGGNDGNMCSPSGEWSREEEHNCGHACSSNSADSYTIVTPQSVGSFHTQAPLYGPDISSVRYSAANLDKASFISVIQPLLVTESKTELLSYSSCFNGDGFYDAREKWNTFAAKINARLTAEAEAKNEEPPVLLELLQRDMEEVDVYADGIPPEDFAVVGACYA